MLTVTKSAFVILFLTTLILPLSSCKKDDVKKPKGELLVGTWKITSDLYSPAYDLDRDGKTETEVYQLYNTCSKDDLMIFNKGGNGLFDQGPTMCQSNPDQVKPFTWSLYNNDHTLVLAGESYALLEVNETLLKIAYTFEELGVTYTNTLTFNRR